MRFLVGLDDTDAGDSIGTGGLARELGCFLARDHGVEVTGITRHQLFVHPDIPYTSHNSSACIELEAAQTAAKLHDIGCAFISRLFHPGADPGLCVATPSEAGEAPLQSFGQRAQLEIVTKGEALHLATVHHLSLTELGGTGLGVIGALCACALRAGGNDGRFLALPGARQVSGAMMVSELTARVPAIQVIVDENGELLQPGDLLDTRGWIRPELRGGRAVLLVEHCENHYAVRRRKGGDGDI